MPNSAMDAQVSLLSFHIKKYFHCKYFYLETREGKRALLGRLCLLSFFPGKAHKVQGTHMAALQMVFKHIKVQSTDIRIKLISCHISRHNKFIQVQFTNWQGIDSSIALHGCFETGLEMVVKNPVCQFLSVHRNALQCAAVVESYPQEFLTGSTSAHHTPLEHLRACM